MAELEALNREIIEAAREWREMSSQLSNARADFIKLIKQQNQFTSAVAALKSPVLSSVASYASVNAKTKQLEKMKEAELEVAKKLVILKQKEVAREQKLYDTTKGELNAKVSNLAAVQGQKEQKSLVESITTDVANKEADVEVLRASSGGRSNPFLSRAEAELVALQNSLNTEQSRLDDLQSYTGVNNDKLDDAENKLTSEVDHLNEKMFDREKSLDNAIYGETLARQSQDRLTDELDEMRKRHPSEVMLAFLNVLRTVTTSLSNLVVSIRKMQQTFGVAADQAVEITFTNIVSSIKSFASSLLSAGEMAGVTAEEIAVSQEAFQKEFGGVLTSGSAENIARQAKEMGVGASELAKARRVFMTQTMGNLDAATAQQDKFIDEFKKKGLTSKDAMAAIAQNSELLARNGTRFATSFARAAAEAKKIGVDLSKIDQVGDNIIGDFEGFLEKQAELGAMGFGFDTSRLAEVAETGDTGALFGELRSQLASTGKDITKLRRSEQLALSQAFGISMEELQRMAGGGGSGEQLTDQEQTNSWLERLVNFSESASKAISLAIAASTALTAFNTGITSGTLTTMAATLTTIVLPLVGIAAGVATIVAAIKLWQAGSKNVDEAKKKLAAGQEGGTGQLIKGRAQQGAGMGGLAGGSLAGILAGLLLMGTGVGILPGLGIIGASIAGGGLLGASAGAVGGATEGAVEAQFRRGDDVISQAGYGSRSLITPKGIVALNNSDNIIAYADDMISQNVGVDLLPKGAIASEAKTAPNINIDLSRLEQKLDQVVRAIGSMEVKMDGNKVGKVIVASDQKAATAGVFRAQRI